MVINGVPDGCFQMKPLQFCRFIGRGRPEVVFPLKKLHLLVDRSEAYLVTHWTAAIFNKLLEDKRAIFT